MNEPEDCISKNALLPFFSEEYIAIYYQPKCQWIEVDWMGYQTETSVKIGANQILEAVKQYKCKKVLNDNTHVVGIWSPAAEWGGKVWIPAMIQAGVSHFAWIYSPSALSQFSTKKTLANSPKNSVFKTFDSRVEAVEWLKSVNN